MLHRGRRQRGLQADADYSSVSAGKGRGPHGKKHHDAQSHPWPPGEQSCLGEVSFPPLVVFYVACFAG